MFCCVVNADDNPKCAQAVEITLRLLLNASLTSGSDQLELMNGAIKGPLIYLISLNKWGNTPTMWRYTRSMAMLVGERTCEHLIG